MNNSEVREWKIGKTWQHRREGCSITGEGKTKTAARDDWARKMTEALGTSDSGVNVIIWGDHMAVCWSDPWGYYYSITDIVPDGNRPIVASFGKLGYKSSADSISDAEDRARVNLAWRAYDPAEDLAHAGEFGNDAIPSVIVKPDAQREYRDMRAWQRLAQTFKIWAEREGQELESGPVPADQIFNLLHTYACSEHHKPAEERKTPKMWYLMQARGLT